MTPYVTPEITKHTIRCAEAAGDDVMKDRKLAAAETAAGPPKRSAMAPTVAFNDGAIMSPQDAPTGAMLPVALVVAELAAPYPQQGGVFRWIGKAFGPEWGFAVVYRQWQAWMMWLPTGLIFGASALADVFWPQSFHQALAANKLYTVVILLVAFWAITLFTFRGMAASVQLSTLGRTFGTIMPGAILILLAAVIRTRRPAEQRRRARRCA